MRHSYEFPSGTVSFELADGWQEVSGGDNSIGYSSPSGHAALTVSVHDSKLGPQEVDRIAAEERPFGDPISERKAISKPKGRGFSQEFRKRETGRDVYFIAQFLFFENATVVASLNGSEVVEGAETKVFEAILGSIEFSARARVPIDLRLETEIETLVGFLNRENIKPGDWVTKVLYIYEAETEVNVVLGGPSSDQIGNLTVFARQKPAKEGLQSIFVLAETVKDEVMVAGADLAGNFNLACVGLVKGSWTVKARHFHAASMDLDLSRHPAKAMIASIIALRRDGLGEEPSVPGGRTPP